MNLTRSQLLLWAGQRLSPDAPLYNMALAFAIESAIDRPAFQVAFQALLDRCDALRIVIDSAGGQPVQRVRPAFRFDVPFVDLTGDPDPEDALRQWANERAAQPFDLRERLFDAALVAVAGDRHAWYLNQHHLITDGWSVALVYRHLSDLYARALSGTLAESPQLPAYADHVEYEEQFVRSARFETAKRYWQERFAVLPEPARLYGKTADRGDTRTSRWTRRLGAQRSARLRALASHPDAQSLTEHLSLFNLFLTALTGYLYRVSGRHDVTVGAPAHNRPTASARETAGLFMEVLPLRVRLSEGETFSSLLRKVKHEAHAFLRHAQPGVSAFASRGYNVVLNYIPAAFSSFAGHSMTSTWVHPGHGDSRHDLRLQVHDFDGRGEFVLHFDFKDDVISAAEGDRAVEHFLRILDAMLDDPSRRIDDVEIVTVEERNLLIRTFQHAAALRSRHATVVDLFDAQVRRLPDAPAVVEKPSGAALTYDALRSRADQLAAVLVERGLLQGERVGLLAERSADMLVGILAILSAGGAYVPMDPAHPAQRLTAIAEDAGVRLVVTQRAFAPLAALTSNALLVIEDVGPIAAAATRRAPGGGDPAYVLYTSGSTGRPKGVVVSHAALANYVSWAGAYYAGGTPTDFPLFTPLTFDLTVTSVFVPLIAGGKVVVYPASENAAAAVRQVFADDDVDAVKLTPSHLRVLVGRHLANSRIRTLIVGGEDLKTELAASVYRAGDGRFVIYNEYGPTEATVGCTVHRFDPERDDGPSVPIGEPAAGARIYVLNERQLLVPVGVSGEICVGGPGLAAGYLNRPDLTSDRFVEARLADGDRVYRTGDVGRWRMDGTLEYLGRADDQLKIRGVRVEPAEVEAALLSHRDVTEAVVRRADLTRPRQEPTHFCVQCGLPSNFPGASFDSDGLCNLCTGFDAYRVKAQRYFRGMDELRDLFQKGSGNSRGTYDCLMLLSGGKDSTYALYQLVGLGLKVLAFTLDNGYLSEGAKSNIRSVTHSLGIDHVFGTTPAMNAIFADSLRRYSNVCNGCFKTIYTLGIQLALENGITHIVTGLSRGQFFETRLTEELFWSDGEEDEDADRIDLTILQARKAYHRADDAVSQLLDVQALQDDALFERVRFVDFYRYCDVSLEEMLRFLDEHAPWIRPEDTGRSTNCLINVAGIHVHKLERGYHNYAFPYSWDVRMGHKTRAEALDELSETIDEDDVRRMLHEIGYEASAPVPEAPDERLVAYYVAKRPIDAAALRAHLEDLLPEALIPDHFVSLDEMPLNANGKIDRASLPTFDPERSEEAPTAIAPRTELEQAVAQIWADVLKINVLGVTDELIALGGNSLLAIQIIGRVNRQFGIDLSLQSAFVASTVEAMAALVESTLVAEIERMTDEEARALTLQMNDPAVHT